MSPAGMPCASTVTEPLPEPLAWTLIWRAGTAGAGSELMLGQPDSTGTTTTRSSPSWCSLRVGPGYPGLLVDRRVTVPSGCVVTA